MGEGEPKTEATLEAPSTPPVVEVPKEVAEEETVNIYPPSSEEREKVDDPNDSKVLAVVEMVPELTEEKISGGSDDRDVALARLETEKTLALIRAWEDSEKTKAQNKALKKLYAIESWENSKKAALEAKLKKIEEQLEKKKAEYVEKMKNEVAFLHKEAEEKRAMIEAKRGEETLKAEETAEKYRASGTTPKTFIRCFRI